MQQIKVKLSVPTKKHSKRFSDLPITKVYVDNKLVVKLGGCIAVEDLILVRSTPSEDRNLEND